MTWVGDSVREAALRDAYLAVQDAAAWSPWAPFDEALSAAPREPGVYLFGIPETERIVHVGMAGERAGSGRPQGLYGRLSVYRSGQGAVGGFAEAALDRALGDPAWIRGQLDQLEARGPRRAKVWAADAISWLSPTLSWAVCAERADAKNLEDMVLGLLRPHDLWTR